MIIDNIKVPPKMAHAITCACRHSKGDKLDLAAEPFFVKPSMVHSTRRWLVELGFAEQRLKTEVLKEANGNIPGHIFANETYLYYTGKPLPAQEAGMGGIK